MARIPRKELIEETEVGIYHCINRCVRRAFLCGQDALTGKNFDHRKVWIRERLEFLAGQFSIEVCGFAVMSNHLHLVLRNRPDIVSNWSDEEVARRWWNLFPGRKEENKQPAKPNKHELAALMADKEAVQERRRRLSSLSWFMRCLAEPIARQANREDECTGRFWEGRYKCQRLLDEAAVLACSVYVDLNPIRAGVAKTPETSEFTSGYERAKSRRPRAESLEKSRVQSQESRAGRRRDAGWLAPVELKDRREMKNARRGRRASNKGFLPLKLDQYLKLLDWTGRQTRGKKRGQIPDHLEPILTRLQIATDTWVDTVLNFGRWFHRAVGRPDSLSDESSRRGRQWLHGTAHSRTAFG